MRLSFDHRIFDGALAGRILARLDQVLNSSILEELRQLKSDATGSLP
jgi:pyruvate/2-oxoglutarate dehydrogenase complex dihydrolipoamide acyltransferase (E2) component